MPAPRPSGPAASGAECYWPCTSWDDPSVMRRAVEGRAHAPMLHTAPQRFLGVKGKHAQHEDIFSKTTALAHHRELGTAGMQVQRNPSNLFASGLGALAMALLIQRRAAKPQCSSPRGQSRILPAASACGQPTQTMARPQPARRPQSGGVRQQLRMAAAMPFCCKACSAMRRTSLWSRCDMIKSVTATNYSCRCYR